MEGARVLLVALDAMPKQGGRREQLVTKAMERVAANAICSFLETVAREVDAGNGAAAGLPTSLPAEAVADWLRGLRAKIERSN